MGKYIRMREKGFIQLFNSVIILTSLGGGLWWEWPYKRGGLLHRPPVLSRVCYPSLYILAIVYWQIGHFPFDMCC